MPVVRCRPALAEAHVDCRQPVLVGHLIDLLLKLRGVGQRVAEALRVWIVFLVAALDKIEQAGGSELPDGGQFGGHAGGADFADIGVEFRAGRLRDLLPACQIGCGAGRIPQVDQAQIVDGVLDRREVLIAVCPEVDMRVDAERVDKRLRADGLLDCHKIIFLLLESSRLSSGGLRCGSATVRSAMNYRAERGARMGSGLRLPGDIPLS